MNKLTSLLTSLILVTAAAHAATLPSSEDSSSSRGKLTIATNKAATLPVDGTRHAFVYFDLSELPTGTQLRYARLRLYLPNVVRAGAGLTLHKTTGQWDEAFASIEPAFNPTPLATLLPVSLGTKRFVSVDVTATVQGWLATPSSNQGFALAVVPAASAKLTASVLIGAKEGSGSGYPAELEVEIASDALAPGAVGNTQLASGLTLGGTTSGTFSGPLTGNVTGNVSGSAASFTGNLEGDVTGIQDATVIAKVGGVTATNIASGANLANAATTANTPNTIVKRDAAGNIPGVGIGANSAAFIHVTTAGNVTSMIDHPLCNGDPNAILIITHQATNDLNTSSNLHDHVVGVNYYNGKWYILNEDFAFMPGNFRFNILVIKP